MVKSTVKHKILILGAIASGKTKLARRLSKELSLPIIHVDQLEFNSDLSKKNIDQVRESILVSLTQSKWILDGYGPLDLLPENLKKADQIIFLDFPRYLNIFFLLKRQVEILFHPRLELPDGANEWNLQHFKKMLQTLFKQHRLMNPELRRILSRPENQKKLIHIQKLSDLSVLGI